jgi:hypothetical protein
VGDSRMRCMLQLTPEVSVPIRRPRGRLARILRMVLGARSAEVCAVQRRRFPVAASPTRQSLQPEAIGAVMEVTKWLKPSISVSQIGDGASVQAATRVNAEQSAKSAMHRSTRHPYRGRLIRLDEMSQAIRSDAAGHPPRLAAEMSLSSGGNRPHRESALAWLAVRRHAQLGERFVG